MKLLLALAGVMTATACGASRREPVPANQTEAPVAAPTGRDLVVREFVDRESGNKLMVWLEHGRDASIDTSDPCCGVSYDGNRYDDRLASCAVRADECGPNQTGVYPGLADDAVCGTRRRCVPLPLARLIVSDGSAVVARDGEDVPLATGTDPASVTHQHVSVGREGFLVVTAGKRMELVAVDYGARYTIVARGGRIERVTRD